MDFLSLLTDTAWFTAATTFVGSVVTYFATKNSNKKELAINDRTQLSKDQYQLIAELRQMMQEQKEETEGLRQEIQTLQKVNLDLMVENKGLQIKIAELTARLEKFEKKEGK